MLTCTVILQKNFIRVKKTLRRRLYLYSAISVFILYQFLRATAVPAGTAERVLAMAVLPVWPSVCLGCRDPVPNQAQVR